MQEYQQHLRIENLGILCCTNLSRAAILLSRSQEPCIPSSHWRARNINHMVSYFIQCCFRRQRLFQLPLLQLSSFNLPVRQFQKVSALIPTKDGLFKSSISRLSYRTMLSIDTKEKVTGRSIVSNPVEWLWPVRAGEQNSGSEIDRNCAGRGHGINHEMKSTAL